MESQTAAQEQAMVATESTSPVNATQDRRISDNELQLNRTPKAARTVEFPWTDTLSCQRW